jgi:hypothetical protein
MAQNDNTLGAPTEGLGQNVTFAFNPTRSPQAEAGAAQGIQASLDINGNTSFHSQAVAPAMPDHDPTVQMLFKIGEPLVRPFVQQRQTEQYIAGMQKAMQGEAIQDIAANRPWYSKLFGETDVVEGARQYYSNTRAQEVVSSMEDNMPELRKMQPAAAQKYYSENVTAALTGDRAADAAIMQGFVRAAPALMRRQAKEHYGWRQEEAATAETANFKAGATSLQLASQGLQMGYITPEEFAVRKADLVRSWAPAEGRDSENYQKTMAANLIAAAEQGQFHAINALREPIAHPDGTSISFLEVLTPQQRNAVEGAVNAGEARLVNKYSTDWSERIADLKFRARMGGDGASPKELYDQGVSINDEFQKATGVSYGVLSPNELIGIKETSGLKIAAATEENARRAEANLEKARALGDKSAAAQAAENEKDSVIVREGSNGNLGLLVSMPGYTEERANFAFRNYWLTKDPATQLRLLQSNFTNHGYTVKSIANEMDGQVSNQLLATKPTLTTGMEAASARFDAMYNQSPSLALAYHPVNGAKLLKYRQLRDTGAMDAPTAFDAAFVQPTQKQKVRGETLKAITAEIVRSQNSIVPAWLGGSKLRKESVDVLTDLIGPDVETVSESNHDVTLSTKMVIEAKKSRNELDILGEHVVPNRGNGVGIESYLVGHGVKLQRGQVPIGTDRVGDVFNEAIREKLNTTYETGADGKSKEVYGIMAGKTLTNLRIVRNPDREGVPQLAILAADEDNVVHTATLSADSIFSLSARKRARGGDIMGLDQKVKQDQKQLNDAIAKARLR